MNIRKATYADIEAMVEEGLNFIRFVAPDKVVNPDDLYLKLVSMVTHKSGVVYVAIEGGRFAGAIGGIIAPNIWFSDELNLTELFWWVPEHFRGSSAGLRLLKRFIEHGRESEVNRVIMSMEDISPLSDDVFTKRGFKLKEKAFIMEV